MNIDRQEFKKLYLQNPDVITNTELVKYLTTLYQGDYKQMVVNLKILFNDLIAMVNLPENNNDAPAQYKLKTKGILKLTENQVDKFIDELEATYQKNLVTSRKSPFQIDKAIMNYIVAMEFKATPEDIGNYAKYLLENDVDTTFLYSPRQYDKFLFNTQTIDIISDLNVLPSKVMSQMSKKGFGLSNNTYYSVGNYLPSQMNNYDIVNFYAKFAGLKTLINIADTTVNNLIFFTRSTMFKSDEKYFDADTYLTSNNLVNWTDKQKQFKELLWDNGIYTSFVDRKEFEQKVMENYGINIDTLTQILNYSDDSFVYSNSQLPLNYVSRKELTNFEKQLMFLMSFYPSGSSLTEIILGKKVANDKMSADDVVNVIENLVSTKEGILLIEEKVKQFINEKVEKSIIPNEFDINHFVKLPTIEDKTKYLVSVNFLGSKYPNAHANKYLSYGTYSEDLTIKHFNWKNETFINKEKRTMNVGAIYGVPYLNFNIDGFTLTNNEQNQRKIDSIVEVKSKTANIEMLTSQEVKKLFATDYLMQTMFYANTLNVDKVDVLYHINNKDAYLKYKSFRYEKDVLRSDKFVPTMKKFYTQWQNTLIKLYQDPELKPFFNHLNHNFIILKSIVQDSKFKETINNYKNILDLIGKPEKQIVKVQPKQIKDELIEKIFR